MTTRLSALPLRVLSTIGLCAGLGAWLPANATLALSASGSYTLGVNSGAPGTVASPTTGCGTTGQDALVFTGAANNIGIHSYACDFGGMVSFGSRASGEGTYYVDATASVTGQITASGGTGLSFLISGGQVGAFGSTAFGVGEYQQSSLSILLVIDGVTYLNDSWSTAVVTGGVTTYSETHGGPLAVSSTGPTIGAGFVSYGINGGPIDVAIADGTYDISYVMTAVARGSLLGGASCLGTIYEGERIEQGDGGQEPGGAQGFQAYCGAGAQSGDPFPPIARALVVPEPGSIGLVAAALVALGAIGRRRRSSVVG